VDGSTVYGTISSGSDSAYVGGSVFINGVLYGPKTSYPECVFPKEYPDEPGDWKSCGACGRSGTYIDYCGPQAPCVAVPCKVCRGRGWIPKEK
jgi:hypothetical protein